MSDKLRKYRSRWGVWMRTEGPSPVTLFPMPPGCTHYPDYVDGRRQRWISADRSADLMRAMMSGLAISPTASRCGTSAARLRRMMIGDTGIPADVWRKLEAIRAEIAAETGTLDVGAAIRAAGISQAAFAALHDVSPNTVTSWVHGRTVPPKRVRDWIRRNAK